MTSLRTKRPLRLLVLLLVALNVFLVFVFCTQFRVHSSLNLSQPSRRSTRLPGPDETDTSSVLVLEPNDSLLLTNDSRFLDPAAGGTKRPVLLLRGRNREKTEVTVPLSPKFWRKLTMTLKEAETAMFPWKLPRVRRVNCIKVFQGDPSELARARHFEQQSPMAALPDQMVKSLARSCPSFIKMFGFITSSLTEEERNFPIAYSLLVFKDAEQVVNLLRAIYRPQNYYCIHVDSKSHEEFNKAISAVAACFPNVFLSSRTVDVQWGRFTVLEPEIICMRDLWARGWWRYFINLTGQEFPLRTNWELVQILTAYQGANNLEGTRQRANRERWTGMKPAPGGINPTKGSVHVVVNRDFVDFILHTTLGRDFLAWAQHGTFPDEVFFSSLNHNPQLGIRGTYTGDPETHPTNYPFLTRFKNWGGFPFDYPCASGKRVRLICILSSGDLPFLATRFELFANKFYAVESRVALDCLAERIFNRTRDQFLGHVGFNVSYYANMPFVKKRVKASTFERDLL